MSCCYAVGMRDSQGEQSEIRDILIPTDATQKPQAGRNEPIVLRAVPGFK